MAECLTFAKWLDYNSRRPKLLAMLTGLNGSSDSGGQVSLAVIRSHASDDSLQLDKMLAERTLPRSELVEPSRPSAILATWDFPNGLANKAAFLNRLVALLKQIDGRCCVDFYGTNLHTDGDCRLWLAPKDDPLGRPFAIRFVDIPVRKETGKIAAVTVLAVTLRAVDGSISEIGLDFPLCRPALMEQIQKLTASSKSKASGGPTPGRKLQNGPDLVNLVGDDLLEEFARRLVNGTYR